MCYPHEEESGDGQAQPLDLEMSQATNGTTTSTQPSKPITIQDLLNQPVSPIDNSDSEGVFNEIRRIYIYGKKHPGCKKWRSQENHCMTKRTDIGMRPRFM